jgi:hypothetical protein
MNKTRFALLALALVASATSYAEPIPPACQDRISAELGGVMLGSFDHPAADRIYAHREITFRTMDHQTTVVYRDSEKSGKVIEVFRRDLTGTEEYKRLELTESCGVRRVVIRTASGNELLLDRETCDEIEKFYGETTHGGIELTVWHSPDCRWPFPRFGVRSCDLLIRMRNACASYRDAMPAPFVVPVVSGIEERRDSGRF